MSELASPEIPLDELVEDVTDQTEEDSESIRRWLDPFTDGGAVTAAAIEASVTDVSQILATAETRVDLASRAYESATDAADAAPDLAVIAVRRQTFEERLGDLRADVEALGEELGAARGDFDSPMSVYRSAVNLHEITTDAQRVVRVAHDLENDLEAFEAWLGSANRRHDGLTDDIEAAEESAAAVAETAETLRADDDSPPERWFDATVQAHVLDLVVDDLRAEAADLRTWADREGVAFPDDIGEQIDGVEDAVRAASEALGEHPNWDDRFDDRLAALESELSAVSPPVPWERVDETIAEAQGAVSTGSVDGGSGRGTADR